MSLNPGGRCYSYERAGSYQKVSPVTVRTEDINRSSAQASEELAQFESAFQEHWPRVYGVVFRLVGDRAEAEDLALETFWRLFQRPPRMGENLAGWLYRV